VRSGGTRERRLADVRANASPDGEPSAGPIVLVLLEPDLTPSRVRRLDRESVKPGDVSAIGAETYGSPAVRNGTKLQSWANGSKDEPRRLPRRRSSR